MKKIVALFLAVCMLATLAGCGEKNSTAETEKPSQTETTQVEPTTKEPVATEGKQEQANNETAGGTILDAPEVVFDSTVEELYVSFTYPKDGSTASMEIAVDQVNEDTYLIYSTDGMVKNHEIVYEVTEAGVTKYYKDVFMAAFEKDAEATAEQLEKEKNTMLSLVGYFMMEHADYAGVKYRKSDVKVAGLISEAYVYDMMENNECVGQACIDKTTGLMINLKDAKGETLFTVLDFKVADVEIPAYK